MAGIHTNSSPDPDVLATLKLINQDTTQSNVDSGELIIETLERLIEAVEEITN